jgi:hypothetical protein
MSAMWRLFWPSVAFLVATLVALAVRGALLALARRWAKPQGPVAALGEAVRVPSLVWCLVLGLYVAVDVASELERLPRRLSEQLAVILGHGVSVRERRRFFGVGLDVRHPVLVAANHRARGEFFFLLRGELQARLRARLHRRRALRRIDARARR